MNNEQTKTTGAGELKPGSAETLTQQPGDALEPGATNDTKTETDELPAETADTTDADEKAPNVAFVGKPDVDKDQPEKVFRENEPLAFVMRERRKIELPEPSAQIAAGAAGFYIEPADALFLKRAFRKLYKTPVKKGK